MQRLVASLWLTLAAPAFAATPDAGVALSVEDAWTWVITKLPEEKGRFAQTDHLVPKLLAWGRKLTVFDRACRPLKVTNTGEALVGIINVEAHREGPYRKVHSDELVFDSSVTAVCGSDETYERQGGRWVLVASGGTGCAQQLGHLLSRVTPTEAWYGGASAKVELVCASRTTERQTCTDGSTRTCSTCSQLALGYTAAGHTIGIERSVRGVDCSQPCAPDELGAKLLELNAALTGAEFMTLDLEPHPTLFRTLEACQAYRRRHRVAKDELAPLW